MPFDTALNVIWLGLSVLALASILRLRADRFSLALRLPSSLQVCGLAVILAALFPYISATDDVLRIQHMDLHQGPQHPQESGKGCSKDGLLRLYEALDSPMVLPATQISFVLLFISLVIAPVVTVVSRSLPFASGRSPPLRSLSAAF